MDTNSDEQDRVLTALYEHATYLLIVLKKTPRDVKRVITEQGLSAEIATTVVDAIRCQFNEAKKKKGQRDMLLGALLATWGFVISLATNALSFGWWVYVLAWGLVIWGAIRLIRGHYEATDLMH